MLPLDGRSPRIKSAAFSAIATVAALVLPEMMFGLTDASITLKHIAAKSPAPRIPPYPVTLTLSLPLVGAV